MYISNNINNKRIDKVYLENIRSFIERMKDVLPEECLKNMYANIENVSIKHASRHYDYSYYNCVFNKIRVRDYQNTLWHELLHLSSGRWDKEHYAEYNGFRFTKYTKKYRGSDFDIGIGLNEGYTQLLTERYFSDRKTSTCYAIEKDIAKMLESIVGREKMQKLYFNADLLGLIRELEQYTNDKEIVDFLKTLDFINGIPEYIKLYKKKDRTLLRRTIIKKYQNINHFLLKIDYIKNHSFNLSPISKMMICGEIYDIESDAEIEQYIKKLVMKIA